MNKYLMQERIILDAKELAAKNPQRKNEYERRISDAYRLREEIEQKIDGMEDAVLSELLCQKYVLGRTLEEIGYILNYSKRHTERLHIKALEKFKL